MPSRLIEIYTPGGAVEIRFADEADETDGPWHPAIVRALHHPGVWVQTADGLLWFVTNGRRIRPRAADASSSDPR